MTTFRLVTIWQVYNEKYYYSAADIIELGGKPYNDVTITKELKRYIEILFADQKNTYKYNHVIYKLDYYDSKLSEPAYSVIQK